MDFCLITDNKKSQFVQYVSRDVPFRPSFLERVSGLVFLFLRLTLISISTPSPFITVYVRTSTFRDCSGLTATYSVSLL